MDFKTVLKTSVAAGALFAFAAPISVAEAGGLSNANSKADVKLGARVHRSIVSIDDGTHEDVFLGSGVSGNSEIWLDGSAKLTENVTVGGYVRFDVEKQSQTLSFGSTHGDASRADGGFADKYEYIYFKHASMGTLTIGDQEGAADGTMDGRYVSAMINAGYGLASGADVTSGTAGAFGGEVADYIVKIDGDDGSNKIKWNAPAIGGLSLALDYSQDGGGSAGLKYAGKAGGMDFKAGAGYENRDNTQKIGGHVAFKHASGLNVALNYGTQKSKDTSLAAADDPEFIRVIGGYSASMNSLGTTDFILAWAEGEDNSATEREGESIRIGIFQKLDAIGADMGLEYVKISFEDNTTTDYNDMDVVAFNTSFNF